MNWTSKMSRTDRGNRTYRRGGSASTARSTTSVDTNVLLKRADDVALDTSRSAVSVDTDVLLGDLASTRDLEEPRHVSETQAPLNSTYAKSPHLSASTATKAPTNLISAQTLALVSSLTGTKAPTNLDAEALISSSSTGTEAALNSCSSQSSSQLLSLETRGARISTRHSTSTHLPSPASTGTGAKWNLTSQSASSSTGTKATLNSTYATQPASLPPSSSTDDMVSNQVRGSRAQFHADRMSRTQLERSMVTARSVASAECAPVDYDDDVLSDNVDHRGSSGFEVSILNKRHLSEKCPSVNNDHSLFRVGSSGFEVSALDKRHSSEGPCPVSSRYSGPSGFDVSMLDKHRLSDVCPSDNDDRNRFRVVSSGFEVSVLDKRNLSERPRPVSTHQRGSSGFETPVLEQRRLSENDDDLYQVTARSDSSLDAAMMLRDSAFSPPGVDDVLPDSGTTSRTLASVDTNVLLQTKDDVVMAMEAARTNQHSHSPSRDPSPPIRNDSVLSYEDTDRNLYGREDVAHSDADYETETVDLGNARVVLPQSSVLTKPPPANGKSHTASYGRHGTKEAWGNLSDYDIPEDIGTSGTKTYGGHKTVQLPHKRAMQGDFGGRSEYAGRPHTALRPELDRRRYTGQLRCRSGTRTYPGQDSDRSLASTASLGEKIVAKSRQNQRPASGKASRTSNNVARKNAHQQQQHDRDLSPSGLVLEGCRVQLRRTFSNSHERTDARPSSAVARRQNVNNTRGAAATSVTSSGSGSGSRLHQSGRSDSRTSPGVGVGLRTKMQNGWIDDTSSLNDSLYADSETAGSAATGARRLYSNNGFRFL